MTIVWLADTRDDHQRIVYRIGRDGEARVAEWPGVARLRCVPGHMAELNAEEGAKPLHVSKIRQGIARGLVRSLDGAITLHASAVARAGEALLCIGPSGAGKSTIATALCRLPGFALLSDDMCEVRWADPSAVELEALPGETATWLAPTGAREKVSFPQTTAVEAARVRALICVRAVHEAEAPRFERLRGAALLRRLVPCLVRFALDDPERHAREIDELAKLCRIPAFELVRSSDLAHLSETADALARLLPDG